MLKRFAASALPVQRRH